MAGDADLAAQIEQIVLHLGEDLGDIGRRALCREETDGAIQFVQFAERAHPRAVFRYA